MQHQVAPACRGFSRADKRRQVSRTGLTVLLTLIIWTSSHIFAAAEPGAGARVLKDFSGGSRPALPLIDFNGSRIDLGQISGKVVLVHFFATWCESCRPELKSLSNLRARNGDAVAVLAVSVAEPPIRLRRYFEKNPVNFPVALDADRAATKAWGVNVLPTTFVLDPDGAVRMQVEGDLDWSRPDVLARLSELQEARPNQPTQ